jgi:gamma-polyglutamate biosynthesis protein CapA
MKNTKLQKIIIALILLVSFVLMGVFLVGKKTVSFEQDNIPKPSIAVSQKVELVGKTGSVKILFVGDLMFDRYIRQTAERKGDDFVFAGVQTILAGSDLVVGNLEGPITDNASVSVNSEVGAKNNYIFTFNQAIAGQLWQHNIRLVNLGNNHILNFGQDGLNQTKENLRSNKVDFFGDPTGEKRLAVFEKNGLKIVLVAFNQFEKEAKSKTLADLEQAKKMKADQIILYTHWGTEFIGQSEAKIKELAHSFIDSGVDLIIGSHPHVVQDKEEYKGKLIYYSLGNFIFDQYFSPQTQQGLAVQVQINSQDGKISAREIPVTMKTSGQTVLN